MVTKDQVIRGACNYYENEICRKATGLAKFSAYFMLPMIPKQLNDLLNTYSTAPMFSEIFPDGQVDLERARDYAAEAMRQCGCIELMGFRLDDKDVNILYDHIRMA